MAENSVVYHIARSTVNDYLRKTSNCILSTPCFLLFLSLDLKKSRIAELYDVQCLWVKKRIWSAVLQHNHRRRIKTEATTLAFSFIFILLPWALSITNKPSKYSTAYQRKNQTLTVASAPSVTGTVIKQRFRLFLGQCMYCIVYNTVQYISVKTRHWLLHLLHPWQARS